MDSKLDFVYGVKGSVMAASGDAVGIGFKRKKDQSQYDYAIAMKCTCFDNDGTPVTDMMNRFPQGCVVSFDAVLDDESQLPDVWKVAVLWINMKPNKNLRYDVKMWGHALKYVYQTCSHLSCLLDNSQSVKQESHPVIWAIKYLSSFFRSELSLGNVYNILDDDLELVLSSFEGNVKQVITTSYGSLRNFLESHREVFPTNSNNDVFARREILVSKYLSLKFRT